MADYTATTAKSETLTATVADTVTLTGSGASITVFNRSAGSPIYFRCGPVGGTPDATVAGTDHFVVPPNTRTKVEYPRTVSGLNGCDISLISAGAQAYTVQTDATRLLPEAGITADDLDAELTALDSRFVSQVMADPNPPTGALAMSFSRSITISNGAVLLTGRETVTSVDLIGGMTYSAATFVSGSTAGATLTNQWATLRSSGGVLLGVSADDGSTAWDASTAKTFTFASPVVAPSTGRYLVGLMVAATTPPTLQAIGVPSVVSSIPPILVGRDNTNTGLTTPATAPATSGTIGAVSAVPWVYLT